MQTTSTTRRLSLLAGFLAALASTPVSAQEPASLAPGTRVRVTVPTIYRQRWLVGTVESVDSATLVLRGERTGQEGVFSLPLAAVQRIDVSRGMIDEGKGSSIRAREGLVAGLGVAGAVLLFGVLDPADDDAPEGERRSDSGPTFKQAAMIGGGLGGLGWFIGTIAGSRGGERWETISTSGFRLSLARDPRTGGVRVSLGT